MNRSLNVLGGLTMFISNRFVFWLRVLAALFCALAFMSCVVLAWRTRAHMYELVSWGLGSIVCACLSGVCILDAMEQRQKT